MLFGIDLGAPYGGSGVSALEARLVYSTFYNLNIPCDATPPKKTVKDIANSLSERFRACKWLLIVL